MSATPHHRHPGVDARLPPPSTWSRGALRRPGFAQRRPRPDCAALQRVNSSSRPLRSEYAVPRRDPAVVPAQAGSSVFLGASTGQHQFTPAPIRIRGASARPCRRPRAGGDPVSFSAPRRASISSRPFHCASIPRWSRHRSTGHASATAGACMAPDDDAGSPPARGRRTLCGGDDGRCAAGTTDAVRRGRRMLCGGDDGRCAAGTTVQDSRPRASARKRGSSVFPAPLSGYRCLSRAADRPMKSARVRRAPPRSRAGSRR
jgi:hypothetical protein